MLRKVDPFLFTVRVKCSPDDTVGDLKKLIAAQTGTDASKIQLKKWRVCRLNLRNVCDTLNDAIGTRSTRITSLSPTMRLTTG